MTHRQVEELVTQFGPVDLLWFDGANYFTGDDWQSGRMTGLRAVANLDVYPVLPFNRSPEL